MVTHLSYSHANLGLRNCGRDRQTLAPRFGGHHKTHYWVSEMSLENTIIVKQDYISPGAPAPN